MSETPKTVNRDEDIVRLDPREHVRLRPGMYVGGVDKRALHYLIYLVVDDAIELAYTGQCDHIWVTLRDKNEVCIRDNGPEISVDIDKATGRPLLEAFMTQIGVSNERVHGFPEKRYTGLHSMGLWAVNFLSEQLSIEATHNGYLWRQEYKEGVPQTSVTQVRLLEDGEPKGIAITLQPDFSIFESTEFDSETIVYRLPETAYLAAGVTISVSDERQSPTLKREFHFPNGMADLVNDLNNRQQTLHEIIHYRGTYAVATEHRQEKFDVEFALQYTSSNETIIKSYVNTWCMDGGTQIQGLQDALVAVINDKAATQTEKPFTWDEIKMGLTVGLNVKMDDPSFESQTKINLINPTAYDAVVKVIYDGLNIADQAVFKAITEKCLANRNVRRS